MHIFCFRMFSIRTHISSMKAALRNHGGIKEESWGRNVQVPWVVCSTTLGSMLNYPREYVQLPWGVCSTTLGSVFTDLVRFTLQVGLIKYCAAHIKWCISGCLFIHSATLIFGQFNSAEYVQLPSGVFSTTLGGMFNYPREYVQLPSGVCSTTLGSMFMK